MYHVSTQGLDERMVNHWMYIIIIIYINIIIITVATQISKRQAGTLS